MYLKRGMNVFEEKNGMQKNEPSGARAHKFRSQQLMQEIDSLEIARIGDSATRNFARDRVALC